MILFHVSEEPDIALFEPRQATATDERLVWAIDEEHLRNYLVPRDCYHLPGDSFELADECAGYYVSRVPVKPLRVQVIEDPLSAVLQRGVEVRVQPSLWALRDAVITSTLAFSIIGGTRRRP